MIIKQEKLSDAVNGLVNEVQQSTHQMQANREREEDSLRRVLVLELRKNYFATKNPPPQGQNRIFHNKVWLALQFRPITDPATWGRLTYLYDVLIKEAIATANPDNKVHRIPSHQVGGGDEPISNISNMLIVGDDGLLNIFKNRYKVPDAVEDIK